jgi:hypothetical protein
MGRRFWYWGGFSDLEGKLNGASIDGRPIRVMTAAVGPFSSVWDRAVELFYQIKGGTVDYGKAHSEQHGHARFGRTFPGLYPQWDAQHPVHLVAHSMGGLTARCLVHLLSDNGLSRGEDELFCTGGGGGGEEGYAYIRPVRHDVSSRWGAPRAPACAARACLRRVLQAACSLPSCCPRPPSPPPSLLCPQQ